AMPKRPSHLGDPGLMTATMPWGKHRGRKLTDLPTGYLKWVINAADIDAWLVGQAKQELRKRGQRYVPAADVLVDVEESVTRLVCEVPALNHEVCGIVTDCLLDAFAEVRQRFGIGLQTEMVVEPTRNHTPGWSGAERER